MAEVSQDFLRFLEANFYSDWLKLSAPDVPEDVVTAIKMKYAREYQIWREIPEDIKSRFRDKVPSDVLNGHESVQHFVNTEHQKAEKEEKNTAELLSFSVNMLALGYAVDTVKVMAENRAARENLLHAAKGGKLPPEQLIEWLETRKKDIEAITADWKKYQPEKHVLHLAKMLAREKRRQKRLLSDEDRALSDQRIKSLEKKLKEAVKRLDDRSAKMNMVHYLRGTSQQAALRHLTPDILKTFSDLLEAQGIRISPVKSARANNHTLEGRDSFTKDLRAVLDKIEQQTKSVSSSRKLAQALAVKSKKSSDKATKKKVVAKDSPKTTLTLKEVPTLEIV